MGGDREMMAAQKVVGAGGEPVVIGSVRIHENAGEVHFHDGSNKFKAAVPVASWMSAWQDLSRRINKKWRYFDPVNSTLLTVRVKAKSGKQDAMVDCLIRVEPAKASPEYAAVQKFTFH